MMPDLLQSSCRQHGQYAAPALQCAADRQEKIPSDARQTRRIALARCMQRVFLVSHLMSLPLTIFGSDIPSTEGSASPPFVLPVNRDHVFIKVVIIATGYYRSSSATGLKVIAGFRQDILWFAEVLDGVTSPP